MSLCEGRRLDCQCLKMASDKTSRSNTKKSETKSDRFVVYSRTKKTPRYGVENTARERDVVKLSLEVHFWSQIIPVKRSHLIT